MAEEQIRCRRNGRDLAMSGPQAMTEAGETEEGEGL